MGFDIVDAYENIKQLRDEVNFIVEKLMKEGIIDRPKKDKKGD